MNAPLRDNLLGRLTLKWFVAPLRRLYLTAAFHYKEGLYSCRKLLVGIAT